MRTSSNKPVRISIGWIVTNGCAHRVDDVLSGRIIQDLRPAVVDAIEQLQVLHLLAIQIRRWDAQVFDAQVNGDKWRWNCLLTRLRRVNKGKWPSSILTF